jgi:hypothetical protein
MSRVQVGSVLTGGNRGHFCADQAVRVSWERKAWIWGIAIGMCVALFMLWQCGVIGGSNS